ANEPILRGDERLADLLSRRDVVPGPDHLDGVAGGRPHQLKVVADPAVAAVLLAEAVLDREAAVLEEPPVIVLDPGQVLRVNALAPEIRAFEVLLARIAEQLLDVPADEGRRVIARRPEAVDHGRRAREKMLDALMRGGCRLLRRPPLGDVAPRADDLDRLTVRVADQMLDVLHPAVAAVAFPEAVLDRVAAGPIEAGRLRLDRGEIVGMHPLAPELGILEVFGGGVPEELGDVGADEG